MEMEGNADGSGIFLELGLKEFAEGIGTGFLAQGAAGALYTPGEAGEKQTWESERKMLRVELCLP